MSTVDDRANNLLEMSGEKPTKIFRRRSKLLHFDRCVFPHCDNGKHNNHTLFRLPVNPRRQKMWIDIIDNPLLAGYSVNYLSSKAGVCKYHFHPDAFTNAEQNKLQRCVFPIKFNEERNDDYHSSALNLCVIDFKRNCSTPILNDAYNLTVRSYGNEYLTNVDSGTSAKDNDENMNFVSDDGEDPKNYYSFREGIISEFNRSVKAISKVEPGVSLSNGVSKNNVMTGGFGTPQIEISVRPASDDISKGKKLKKDISALKEQNVIYKRKITKDAKLKREKLHYLVKLMSDRKNVQLSKNSVY